MTVHKPVLLNEVLDYLEPQPNQNIIDCTLGGGGHTLALLEKIAPNGRLLAIDADKDAIDRVKEKVRSEGLMVAGRLELVNDNFRNIKTIYESRFSFPIHNILYDLGLSSDQLEVSGRGFSFKRQEPLEMTFVRDAKGSNITATDIVSKFDVTELERIFRVYSQETKARDIAEAIVRARKNGPISTTGQLVEIIESVKGVAKGDRKIHPATKVFQAIRIAVNDELGSLEASLPCVVDILESGGRIAVISFHELEDRMVKKFFREQEEKNTLKTITNKPIMASREELSSNPRASSAKLRVAEKV